MFRDVVAPILLHKERVTGGPPLARDQSPWICTTFRGVSDRVRQPDWESLLRWTAWVTNGADAAMVTDALQHILTGKRLIAVRYADSPSDTPMSTTARRSPHWREGDRDNLGHGIELDFTDGSTWSIIWEQRGSQDGLGIWCGPLMPVHLREARFWDVTRRWRRRGPCAITDLQVFWWPERPAWECGSPGSLSLGGLVLRDHARDRQAIVTIDHRFEVNVYFTPGRARRDGHFNENYLNFGKEPLRTEDGTASER